MVALVLRSEFRPLGIRQGKIAYRLGEFHEPGIRVRGVRDVLGILEFGFARAGITELTIDAKDGDASFSG
jgi:hypothetical protein